MFPAESVAFICITQSAVASSSQLVVSNSNVSDVPHVIEVNPDHAPPSS